MLEFMVCGSRAEGLGLAVGLRSNKQRMGQGKTKRKEKSKYHRNYAQHGFQTRTHPDELTDEPNESQKIKGRK